MAMGLASPSLETLMTLSPTPPIPERSPYRRPSGFDKPLPPLPDDFFQLETELVPKPLFSRTRTLPSKAIHVASIELPSPGAPSPIIYPSDISTVASNRSSIVSVASSRPSTAATSVPSEGPSRASSFTQNTQAPLWVPPLHVSKPMLGRSATLPSKRTGGTRARFASLFPSSGDRKSGTSSGLSTPSIPPPRDSPETCFSPEPVWPPPFQSTNPHFSRTATLPPITPTMPQRASLDLSSRPSTGNTKPHFSRSATLPPANPSRTSLDLARPLSGAMQPHFSRSATLPPKTPQRASLDVPRPLSDVSKPQWSRIPNLSMTTPQRASLDCPRPSLDTSKPHFGRSSTLPPTNPPRNFLDHSRLSSGIAKPQFNRSATLPPETPQRGSLDLPSRPLPDFYHAATPMRICPLSLPPPRSSPMTCFSPEPVGERVATTPTRPTLRRKGTPRKGDLRSLRAKDSDGCLRRSLDLPRSSFMEHDKLEKPVHVEKVPHEKPAKSPSSLGQYTYAMDEKGVFIIRG